MWQKISILILRYRLFFLLGLIGVTAFMGWHATQVRLTYDFARIIPLDNQKYIDYAKFKETFGDDGSMMVLGVQTSLAFHLDFFNDWYELGQTIEAIEGIDGVLSIAHAQNLVKDEDKKAFELRPLVSGKVATQEELDSIKQIFLNLPFYEGLIYNPATKASVMAITFNKEQLHTKERLGIVDTIVAHASEFSSSHHMEVHYSGLPFIRSNQMTTISKEVELFLIMAMIIVALILFLLFRNIYAVAFSLLVVIIGAIWSLGFLDLFDYRITILTGLLPTLIVVIGIPNAVYMLNKYHLEFKKHGNKQKALMRTIAKIGHVTFFTNLTTAIGFGVFSFTHTITLSEFGMVAFLSLISTFLISVVAIPTIFSYLPKPKTKHTLHLENRIINFVLRQFERWTNYHRKKVFALTAIALVIAGYGILRLDARGYILDDVPESSKVYKDLKFFEKNLKGIMPFELMIDTKKKGAATGQDFLAKLNQASDTLYSYPIFSKPLSLAEASKYVMQSYRDGNPAHYRLPSSFELSQDPFLRTYLNRTKIDTSSYLSTTFVDKTKQIARLTTQMADIGSDSMPHLLADITPKLNAIFPPQEYDLTITGTSIIAVEGFNYLVDGLIYSVALAFILISFIMAYLFRSFRMLLLSLVPNVIPLIVTAGIMGIFNIPLKPSTVLIFSVAFGISVDYTIHFLAKYKQELLRHNWDISKTVTISFRETGLSMIYTSLILFFGFILFSLSKFDGTANLGKLTSITLIVAMFSNLVILPSLINTFERLTDRRAIKREPLIDVYNEEEDIEFEKLDFKYQKEEHEV